MRHVISSSLLAALLYSSVWNKEDVAHLARAEEVVEAQHSDAFVASEAETAGDSAEEENSVEESLEDMSQADDQAQDVEDPSLEAAETGESVEANALEEQTANDMTIFSEQQAQDIEEPSSEVAETGESVEVNTLAEKKADDVTIFSEEQAHDLSLEAAESEEYVEANTLEKQTSHGHLSSFSRMRERAEGRINSKQPLPAFPTPGQQNLPCGKEKHQEANANGEENPPAETPAASLAENKVAYSFLRFLDTIFSLNGSDLSKGLQGKWIDELKFLVDHVLVQADNIGDDPNSVETKLKLVNLADAAHMLTNMKPYIAFLEFFATPWIKDAFYKVGDFTSHLKQLLENDLVHDAFWHTKQTDAFTSLQMFRTYWEMATETVPSALIKAIKDYDHFLQLISRQKQHKIDIFSQPIEGTSLGDPHPIASAMLLIQKRTEMINLLGAFETYVLTGFAGRLQEMKAVEAGDSAESKEKMPIMPVNLSTLLPKMFTVLEEEVEGVEKVKNMMVDISGICEALEEESVPSLCRSIAEVVGAQTEPKEITRKLQAYWVSDYPVLSLVADTFSSELVPQIETTLARVPQLFPVISAAATSTVGALIDSSQSVANAIPSATDEVLNFLQSSAAGVRVSDLHIPSLD